MTWIPLDRAVAEGAGARQRDGEREADGDRCIDGVAAALQHLQSDAGRRRLLGHDHAVPSEDRTRGGEGGDDRVGDRRGRSEEEKSEGGELKWSQSMVLETRPTRS